MHKISGGFCALGSANFFGDAGAQKQPSKMLASSVAARNHVTSATFFKRSGADQWLAPVATECSR
jgi:hypothetical protein